ncbi:ATP-dependent DNA helicase [Trichonephila clavipes]|nr:ATP-dependent DNA helicase [Trichonephila clavipes]
MRVQLQQDESSERFAKQLLDIGNGKMEMDESTHCITLPENFCHIVKSTDELIAKVFPNLSQNYKNNQWIRHAMTINDGGELGPLARPNYEDYSLVGQKSRCDEDCLPGSHDPLKDGTDLQLCYMGYRKLGGSPQISFALSVFGRVTAV